ncbi:MAG: hypothetical protein ACUVQT_08670, partial [bacterium]
SYLYTLFLILWLCKEYYQKNLFFQPNYIPVEAHNYVLRGFFALFFYSSFVFGIITIVWWHKYRINLPFLSVIGIFLLGYAIYMREQSVRQKKEKGSISKFYQSIGLMIISMILGYESYFLLIYAIVFGLPLIFLQVQYYRNHFEVGIK